MAEPKKYDPGEHLFSFAGIPLQGFMDGTYVEVERAEDTFSDPVVGADGEIAVVKSRNKSGFVKFTLQATSATNDLLSAKMAIAEGGGAVTGPLFGKDNIGTTVVSAPRAYLKRPANVGLSKDLPGRVWTVACPEIDIFVGGGVVLE